MKTKDIGNIMVILWDLPPDAHSIGEPLAHYPTEVLDQDILQVQLKNGYFVDVSWFPEFNRDGSFYIEVGKDDWRKGMEDRILVKKPIEMAQVVAALCWQYYRLPKDHIPDFWSEKGD